MTCTPCSPRQVIHGVEDDACINGSPTYRDTIMILRNPCWTCCIAAGFSSCGLRFSITLAGGVNTVRFVSVSVRNRDVVSNNRASDTESSSLHMSVAPKSLFQLSGGYVKHALEAQQCGSVAQLKEPRRTRNVIVYAPYGIPVLQLSTPRDPPCGNKPTAALVVWSVDVADQRSSNTRAELDP